MKLVVAVTWVAALARFASADPPPLGEVVEDGLHVKLPAHWVAKFDAKSQTVVAREDPERQDSAVLTVATRPVTAGMTMQKLLEALLSGVKDPKIIGHDRVPARDQGAVVLVDGTIGGIHARIAAIVIIYNTSAQLGLLAATPDRLDAIGGARMLLDSVDSLHPATGVENDFAMMNRQMKHTDQPDLDPDRAAVPRDLIAGKTWLRASGASQFKADHADGSTVYGYNQSAGGGETYAFGNDGSYRIDLVSDVQLNPHCNTHVVGAETGTYTFDGRTLVLTPKHAVEDGYVCNGKPTHTTPKLTGVRRYDLGIVHGGKLAMVGPSCVITPDLPCNDRARWETSRK